MHAPNSNERYPKKILQFESSINVSILQPSDHITICVDPQSYKPINGSTNNVKMHAPNSNERYLKKKIQFGSSINVSVVQPSGHITICVDPQNCKLPTHYIS